MAIFESIPGEPERRRYRVQSPVTFEAIGEFDAATKPEVVAAVERARKAQSDWARLSFDDRAAVLWRLVDQIVARQDEIVDLIVQETGKARSEAISMEVLRPVRRLPTTPSGQRRSSRRRCGARHSSEYQAHNWGSTCNCNV